VLETRMESIGLKQHKHSNKTTKEKANQICTPRYAELFHTNAAPIHIHMWRASPMSCGPVWTSLCVIPISMLFVVDSPMSVQTSDEERLVPVNAMWHIACRDIYKKKNKKTKEMIHYENGTVIGGKEGEIKR